MVYKNTNVDYYINKLFISIYYFVIEKILYSNIFYNQNVICNNLKFKSFFKRNL